MLRMYVLGTCSFRHMVALAVLIELLNTSIYLRTILVGPVDHMQHF